MAQFRKMNIVETLQQCLLEYGKAYADVEYRQTDERAGYYDTTKKDDTGWVDFPGLKIHKSESPLLTREPDRDKSDEENAKAMLYPFPSSPVEIIWGNVEPDDKVVPATPYCTMVNRPAVGSRLTTVGPQRRYRRAGSFTLMLYDGLNPHKHSEGEVYATAEGVYQWFENERRRTLAYYNGQAVTLYFIGGRAYPGGNDSAGRLRFNTEVQFYFFSKHGYAFARGRKL